jgi:hypothetical protein
MYDLSGENLEPWGGDEKLRYTGVKPLTVDGDVVILNGGDWSFTILCEILVNKPS